MNRNHQGRNDHRRTNQGRHKLAYQQLGPGHQSPSYQSYERRFGSTPYRESSREDYAGAEDREWRSHFNSAIPQAPTPKRMKRDERWDDVENDESKSYDYDRFHRGAPPVEVMPREKYRHDDVQNQQTSFHGQDLSYRARLERHPERFVGEHIWMQAAPTENQESFAGMGPKGYRRPDARIEDDVCEILARAPNIDASEVVVAVEDGIVKLTGDVMNREDRYAIERAVDGIWGVEDIVNDIKVQKRRRTRESSSQTRFQ